MRNGVVSNLMPRTHIASEGLSPGEHFERLLVGGRMSHHSADEFHTSMSEFRFGALGLARTRADSQTHLARNRTRLKRDTSAWLDDLRTTPLPVPWHEERISAEEFEVARGGLLRDSRDDRSLIWALRRARWRDQDLGAATSSDVLVEWYTTHWINALWGTRLEHPRTRGPIRREARKSSMAQLSGLYILYRSQTDGSRPLRTLALNALSPLD